MLTEGGKKSNYKFVVSEMSEVFSSGHSGRLNDPQHTVRVSQQAHKPSAVCRLCLHGVLWAIARWSVCPDTQCP